MAYSSEEEKERVRKRGMTIYKTLDVLFAVGAVASYYQVSQAENDDIVKEVFIIFGYSIASIITILSLLWGYNTNTNIFIAI